MQLPVRLGDPSAHRSSDRDRLAPDASSSARCTSILYCRMSLTIVRSFRRSVLTEDDDNSIGLSICRLRSMPSASLGVIRLARLQMPSWSTREGLRQLSPLLLLPSRLFDWRRGVSRVRHDQAGDKRMRSSHGYQSCVWLESLDKSKRYRCAWPEKHASGYPGRAKRS